MSARDKRWWVTVAACVVLSVAVTAIRDTSDWGWGAVVLNTALAAAVLVIIVRSVDGYLRQRFGRVPHD